MTGSSTSSARGGAWVGCSGWDDKPWAGPFYPGDVPARRRFAYYAERFRTVELNATFYRLPSVETVEHWRDQAPGGFRYAVKVSQFATRTGSTRTPSPAWPTTAWPCASTT